MTLKIKATQAENDSLLDYDLISQIFVRKHWSFTCLELSLLIAEYLLISKVPKNARVLAGKSRSSPGGIPQQSPSSQWDSIIKFLDSLMDRLRENHVGVFQHRVSTLRK